MNTSKINEKQLLTFNEVWSKLEIICVFMFSHVLLEE